MWVQSLGKEDPVEEDMAIQFDILAQRMPQTEEPGRLQPISDLARAQVYTTGKWLKEEMNPGSLILDPGLQITLLKFLMRTMTVLTTTFSLTISVA